VTFSSEDIDDPGRVRLARQVTTAAAELTRRIGGQAP
jgi:hypothetical protein